MELDLDMEYTGAEENQEPLKKEAPKLEAGPDPTKEHEAVEGWGEDALELDLDGFDEQNQDLRDDVQNENKKEILIEKDSLLMADAEKGEPGGGGWDDDDIIDI